MAPELLNVPKGIARIAQDASFADALQAIARRYLGERDLQRRGWFDRDEIAGIRTRLRRRRYHAEAAMRLWTVIATEIWARVYLDGRGAKPESERRIP